jgi:hypothetical protein
MIIGFVLVFFDFDGLFLITHGKRKQSTPQRIAPNLPSPIIPHRGSCFFSLSFFFLSLFSVGLVSLVCSHPSIESLCPSGMQPFFFLPVKAITTV